MMAESLPRKGKTRPRLVFPDLRPQSNRAAGDINNVSPLERAHLADAPTPIVEERNRVFEVACKRVAEPYKFRMSKEARASVVF
jgi:hypothetical protein